MRAEIHPAARRITWLVVIIGGIAILTAALYGLLNLGPGIALPFTRTPLDIGWLLIFGLMWLVVGLLMLWWLRPTIADASENDNVRQFEKQFAQLQTAQNSRYVEIDSLLDRQAVELKDLSVRLSDLEKAVEDIRLEVKNSASRPQAANNNHSEQPVVNHLRDLDNELGSLATTIQDAHNRLDNLGDVNSRLHDIDTQLDSLYVTLQDVHGRIDGLEQMTNS